MTNDEGNPNDRKLNVIVLIVIRISSFLRHWGFVIRHF